MRLLFSLPNCLLFFLCTFKMLILVTKKPSLCRHCLDSPKNLNDFYLCSLSTKASCQHPRRWSLWDLCKEVLFVESVCIGMLLLIYEGVRRMLDQTVIHAYNYRSLPVSFYIHLHITYDEPAVASTFSSFLSSWFRLHSSICLD